MPKRQKAPGSGRRATNRNEPIMVDQRPWYYRYGYHLGVWTGAAVGVIWFGIFEDLTGLIIGIVAGQLIGIFLGRQGSRA